MNWQAGPVASLQREVTLHTEYEKMDAITIVLIIGGCLAAICCVGVVRNWNRPSNVSSTSGPVYHFTLTGLLLAIFSTGIAIAILVQLCLAGWLQLRAGRMFVMGFVGIGFGVALMTFVLSAAVFHALGVPSWKSIGSSKNDETAAGSSARQLRYRLNQKLLMDKSRGNAIDNMGDSASPLDKSPPS